MDSTYDSFKRRLSLIERPTHDKIMSQRQQLRDKYYQYLKSSKHHSTVQKSISPSSMEDTDQSSLLQDPEMMPNIRQLREQRHQVGQMLRDTINRYNYTKHEKQKQEGWIEKKKKKYEKVLKIRQDNLREKMELTRSRALMESYFTQQKHRLKRSVDLEKITLGESRVRCLNEKKTIGAHAREEGRINLEKIEDERQRRLEQKRKMHETIKGKESNVKKIQQKIQESKRRMVTEVQLSRIQRELDSLRSIQSKSKKMNSRLSTSLKSLQKTEKVYEKKKKVYLELLKDGSSLKKRVNSVDVGPCKVGGKAIICHTESLNDLSV